MIHILVVDDDEKLTQSICSYLNNCGYEAKGMLSAESAYGLKRTADAGAGAAPQG